MCKSVFICRTCDVVFRECLRTERFRGYGGRGSPAARVEKQEPRWCSWQLTVVFLCAKRGSEYTVYRV